MAHFYLIFFCVTYFFLYTTNYADDTTPHATDNYIEIVLKDLEQGSDTLLKWFTNNLLKANPEKYYLLVTTKKTFKRRGDWNK